MKLAIVLVVGVLASLSSAKPKHSLNTLAGFHHGKIVGGIEAARHEFPWIVDMRRGNSHYCGGSIISPEWVVTAAHCSQSTGYTLTAGDHNIQTDEGTEQTRNVERIIVHPNYEAPGFMEFENDIALMKVNPPFEFNEYVSAVVLPKMGFQPTPVATVTGWGALSQGGPSPANLMKVDVPYVTDAACNVSYSGDIAESMICYGEAGKDSCQGDSGGPIMCGPDNALCGIVSWGYGCAQPGFPGVYTETSYFEEWIMRATVPSEEDEAPVSMINTCGGYHETSSGRINFMVNQTVAANTKCTWTVKTEYDSARFQLTRSGLTAADGLFVTRFDATAATPGATTNITMVGQDYVMNGGMLLITLDIAAGSSAQGFSLDFFSSGFGDASPALSGYADLKNPSGSFWYPESGNYGNGEKALFVLNPTMPGLRTITFTAMDVEQDSSCNYDAVSVYSWSDGSFKLVNKFCGTQLPNPFPIPQGLGLVTFKTDSSIVGKGFSFDWM